MNKLKAIVAFGMGANAGMHITSEIWNRSPENISMAIFFTLIGALFIFTITDPKEKVTK